MTDRPIIIIGAGGHGRVLADALLAAGKAVSGFVDPAPDQGRLRAIGLPVLGGDEALDGLDRDGHHLVNGIGTVGRRDEPTRRIVAERLTAAGWTFAPVRHPSSIVSDQASLAGDVQLLARCVVQTGAEIAAGAIINTAAVVEHDCDVGAYSHVSIGAILCGEVRIGQNCHIGAGAVIRQCVRLGDGTIVGAGAAVVADYDRSGPLVGVPARRLG